MADQLVHGDRSGDRSPYRAIAFLVLTARDYLSVMAADNPSAALADAIRDDDNALAVWVGGLGIDRERAARWFEQEQVQEERDDDSPLP